MTAYLRRVVDRAAGRRTGGLQPVAPLRATIAADPFAGGAPPVEPGGEPEAGPSVAEPAAGPSTAGPAVAPSTVTPFAPLLPDGGPPPEPSPVPHLGTTTVQPAGADPVVAPLIPTPSPPVPAAPAPLDRTDDPSVVPAARVADPTVVLVVPARTTGTPPPTTAEHAGSPPRVVHVDPEGTARDGAPTGEPPRPRMRHGSPERPADGAARPRPSALPLVPRAHLAPAPPPPSRTEIVIGRVTVVVEPPRPAAPERRTRPASRPARPVEQAGGATLRFGLGQM